MLLESTTGSKTIDGKARNRPSEKADCDFWTHKGERGKGDNYNSFHVVSVINCGSVWVSCSNNLHFSFFSSQQVKEESWAVAGPFWSFSLPVGFLFLPSEFFAFSCSPSIYTQMNTHLFETESKAHLSYLHTAGAGASSPVLWDSGSSLLHYPFPRWKLGDWFPRPGVRFSHCSWSVSFDLWLVGPVIWFDLHNLGQ